MPDPKKQTPGMGEAAVTEEKKKKNKSQAGGKLTSIHAPEQKASKLGEKGRNFYNYCHFCLNVFFPSAEVCVFKV